MAVRELTCIICPKGCALKAKLDENGKVLRVTGNTCKRGAEYAENECTNPMQYRHIDNALFGRNCYSGKNSHTDSQGGYLRMYEYNK